MSRTEADRQTAIYNWLSPASAARQLGVAPSHVLGFIADGELQAADMRSKGAKMARWKIKQEWVDAFLESRTKEVDAA